MKKFRILMVGLLAAMMAVGCTSAYFSAASGSAYDDLYVSHDRTVIAERQRAEAEARKAEAEARRAEALALQAEYEAQLAQLNVQSAQNAYLFHQPAESCQVNDRFPVQAFRRLFRGI